MKKRKEFCFMSKSSEQYEDIFSDSSLSEKAEQKKRNKKLKIRFAVIGAIMLTLCGGVGAAAIISNNIGIKNEKPVAAVESKPESKPESKVEEKQVSEISEEEKEVINFKSDAKFTKNFDLFSKDLKKTLEEEILSNYVVLYDVTTDQILYDKDGSKKCYPASTTKLMTAVVSSKYLNKNDVITVGDEIDMVEWDSSKAGLEKGMKLTYEMLLDGLLLPSGNDAAYTIAVATARAYKENDKLDNEECIKIFAEMMNNAAAEMGCKGTHFTVPDGYHDDDHYVTAEDMLRIAAYAQKTPIVMNSCKKSEVQWEILNEDDEEISTESYEDSSDYENDISDYDTDDENDIGESEEESSLTKTLEWYNSNRLIEKNGGQYSKYATGMKTGYTDEAWTCVVSSATMSNHTLIAVVLKSPSNYQKYHESNLLFKEAFKLFDLDYTYNDEWVN